MILPYGHCCQDTKTLTLVNKYNTRKDSSSPPTSRRRCRRSSFLYLRCVFLSRYNFTPPHFQSNSAHATHARENVKSPKNATPPTQFPRRYTFLRSLSTQILHPNQNENHSLIQVASLHFSGRRRRRRIHLRATLTLAQRFSPSVSFLLSLCLLLAGFRTKNATQKIA